MEAGINSLQLNSLSAFQGVSSLGYSFKDLAKAMKFVFPLWKRLPVPVEELCLALTLLPMAVATVVLF